VRATPHSLRAAFTVLFPETHPGELEALQRLLGHRKPETTQIYLRRMDNDRPCGGSRIRVAGSGSVLLQ
jgi:site-specific recombinase XerC